MQDLPGGQMAALAPRSAAPERLPPTVQDVAGAEPVQPRAAAPVAAPAPAEGVGLADMAKRKKENQTAYRGGFAAPLRPRQFRG